MPTYRSITISITSQFDICQLPEYAPPTSTDDPFSTFPALLNPEQALVTVYIPTYPSSQFWLRYSIAPPYPPKAIYYFKLYLNGKCVVSWGCGEDEKYQGKTVFGFLVKAGYLTEEHPKRYYNYALLDPLDKPFASFRYFPRTWDQLVALGVASPTPSTRSSPQKFPTKLPLRKSSNLTISSTRSNSSSSSSSVNTREETVVGTAKRVTLSPSSHAILGPRLLRPTSIQLSSPQKSRNASEFTSEQQMLQNPISAPSLISLSPSHPDTVTQAQFTSLVRRGTRTPSPQKQNIRERVPTPSPTRDSPVNDLGLLPSAPPPPNFTGSSSENLRPRSRRSGSMGLLMNAVNSAVNRKARAASEANGEGGMTGIPEGKTLPLNTMDSDSHDDVSAVGTEDTSICLSDTLATSAEVQQEAKLVDEEKASVESPTPSVQRSKFESESDTSSRKKTKERKGFLGSIFLRKKGETTERSASSTPDGSSSSEMSAKKGRKWGWKSEEREGVKEEQRAGALLDTVL
ncbi:MAG: hypothetical protein Q9195_000874 [Heterodermia aff. obscurata]